MTSIIPLAAAFAPLLIWPIEVFLPYPYLIEELLKAILIYFIIDIPGKSFQVKLAIISGFLFAFSETIMFIFNLSSKGDIFTLLTRLIVTIPLHVGTFLIILLPTFKNKWLIILGLWAAIVIHYFFNLAVASIN